MNNRWC